MEPLLASARLASGDAREPGSRRAGDVPARDPRQIGVSGGGSEEGADGLAKAERVGPALRVVHFLVEADAEAVEDAPHDDGVRLIFADWLEEHGQPERAEFIHTQIELSKLPPKDPRRGALERREREQGEECQEVRWAVVLTAPLPAIDGRRKRSARNGSTGTEGASPQTSWATTTPVRGEATMPVRKPPVALR